MGCEGAAPLSDLVRFRAAYYRCLARWSDTLFELTDALACTGAPVSSVPALSLEPEFRRGHGSLYKALAHGGVDDEALRDLLVAHRRAHGPAIFAIDASSWPRCDADTSAERGYYHHPSRHSAGQPIVAGWSYQWIAQLDWSPDSWTAPVDVARIPPTENTTIATAAQIRALVTRLDHQGPVPMFVLDAGYDAVGLTHALTGVRAELLTRLRSRRVFHTDPTPAPPGTRGRPRRHGRALRLADPCAWPAPDVEHVAHDARRGTVTVHAWQGLHQKRRS